MFYSRQPSASLSVGFHASGQERKKQNKKKRRFFVRRSRKTTATSHVSDGAEEPLNAQAASAGGTWEPYRARLSSFLSARLESPAYFHCADWKLVITSRAFADTTAIGALTAGRWMRDVLERLPDVVTHLHLSCYLDAVLAFQFSMRTVDCFS